MDIKGIQSKIADFLKKYRYAVLVLAVGIIFMLLPSGGKENESVDTPAVGESAAQEISISEELSLILSSIEGAGKVKVMLTVERGEETIYQTDEQMSVSQDENMTKIQTVIVTDASKEEKALIQQVNPPVYLGAIVICQGADSASVRLAMVDAVSKITGLGSDCISVLKMK